MERTYSYRFRTRVTEGHQRRNRNDRWQGRQCPVSDLADPSDEALPEGGGVFTRQRSAVRACHRPPRETPAQRGFLRGVGRAAMMSGFLRTAEFRLVIQELLAYTAIAMEWFSPVSLHPSAPTRVAKGAVGQARLGDGRLPADGTSRTPTDDRVGTTAAPGRFRWRSLSGLVSDAGWRWALTVAVRLHRVRQLIVGRETRESLGNASGAGFAWAARGIACLGGGCRVGGRVGGVCRG
jgi:hypothetical protein